MLKLLYCAIFISLTTSWPVPARRRVHPQRRSPGPGGRIDSESTPRSGRSPGAGRKSNPGRRSNHRSGRSADRRALGNNSGARNARPPQPERSESLYVPVVERGAILHLGKRRPPAAADADKRPGPRLTIGCPRVDPMPRNSDGNPDSPQAVVFLTSIVDVTVGY